MILPMRIRHVRRASFTAAVLAFMLAAPSEGARVITAVDEVALKTEASFDSVTVGQRFHVRYHFTYADSLTPVVPENIKAGTCRAIGATWSDTANGHRIERIGDVTFIPLSVDSSVVPANAFDFVSPAGDTIRAWSDEVPVPIRRIAATATDLRPLKEQWKAPPNYWLWGGIAAGVLAAIIALVWWIRGRRRQGEAIAPAMRLAPDVIALAELDRIVGMGLAERAEYKTHYTLVVDTLRRYLEARYHIEAMDRTTFELLDVLEHRGERIDGLGALLDEADLVKFAKFSPSIENATLAVNRAREIVIHTTPVVSTPDPLAPSEPAPPSQPLAGAS